MEQKHVVLRRMSALDLFPVESLLLTIDLTLERETIRLFRKGVAIDTVPALAVP